MSLLTANMAVIADFGLSLFAKGHSGNYASRRRGNKGWMAPELFYNENGVSTRPTAMSDMYSFAIVCVEVCSTGLASTRNETEK